MRDDFHIFSKKKEVYKTPIYLINNTFHFQLHNSRMHSITSNLNLFFRILRKITLRKSVNLLLLSLTYLISKKNVQLPRFIRPAYLSIEPADFCQLECPECPVGIHKRHSGSTINASLFEQITDQTKDYLIYLNLFFQGEPLLNKNLEELIKHANDAGIFTSISTNAQALTKERAKKIVLSGLGKIIISIDGTTQEVYEQYRKGGKLQKAIDGINYLNYWKRELKIKSPFIELQFIVFKTNEHQIRDIKELAKQLKVDKLTYKSAQIYDLEQGEQLLTSINKYARYKLTTTNTLVIKNKLKNRCWRQWSGGVVNAKGELLPCCFDKNSEFAFGQSNQNSIQTIWHSKTATEFRASILNNRKQHEICRNCTTK